MEHSPTPTTPDQAVIRYLHDCFLQDRGSGYLWYWGDRKAKAVHLLTGTDPLTGGQLPFVSLPDEIGENLARQATLAARDMHILFGSQCILCRARPGLKPDWVAAPLLIYPARIQHRDETWRLSIDHSERRLNLALLHALSDTPEDAENLFEALSNEIPTRLHDPVDRLSLARLLQEVVPDLAVDDWLLENALQDEKALRKHLRKRQPRLMHSALVGLVPRGGAVRGILRELTDLGTHTPPSLALAGFLDEPPPCEKANREKPVTPANLSPPQQAILDAARTHTLSYVAGPPGTGKSFTLANLAWFAALRQEPVLITSRSEQSLAVIHRMLTEELGLTRGVVFSQGIKGRRALRKELENLRMGLIPENPPSAVSPTRILKQQQAIGLLERLLSARNATEMRWGTRLQEQPRSVVARWINRVRRHYIQQRVKTTLRQGELLDQLLAAEDDLRAMAIEHLNQNQQQALHRVRTKHAKTLKTFALALRARTETRRDALLREIDFAPLLQAFPIWLVPLADLHHHLPLKANLFDHVLFDEATQCDIPSVLPALQRAKSAVFFGDAKQLRHLSFLSRKRQRILAQRHLLSEEEQEKWDYRNRSALDIALDTCVHPDTTHLLDEHFRSAPSIIRFSNRHFYNNRLYIMRSPRVTSPPEGPKLVVLTSTSADPETVLREEAAAVVEAVCRIVEQHRALPQAARPSLGIVTPFRSHVGRLTGALNASLSPADVSGFQIRVSTPHGFQGDERDHLFIALGLTPVDHPNRLRFAARADALNVMITRARHRQDFYCSVDPQQLPAANRLRKVLVDAQKGNTSPAPATVPGKDAVSQALEKRGIHVETAVPRAGTVLDLVASRAGAKLAIDLIGFPGEVGRACDATLIRRIRRADLSVYPLSYAAWVFESEHHLDAIEQALSPST